MTRQTLAARLPVVLTVAVAAEMQVEAALLPVDAGLRAPVHAALALLGVALAIRVRRPLLSLAAAQVVFVVVQANERSVPDNLYLPLFVVLFLSVSAAMHTAGRRFWAVPALTAAGGALALLTDDYPGTSLSDVLWLVVIFTGLTAAIGRLLRNRIELQAALLEKGRRQQRRSQEERERAALDERERIAGDLRDIIAHALSGMVVQASAAGRLAEKEPELAREAFAAVEESGREALGELRRLLGVLRREDEDLALTPQPSLAHVEALVARARAAGLPVDLRVEGTAVPLPAGVDLTAYRLLQDALGQALETARAGHAEVTVRYAADRVELEVADDGRAARDGTDRRLLGMRERVGLVGGELHTAARRDGGHRVRARLPLEVA